VQTTPSFDEFVQYLVDPKTKEDGPFNPHWRPQFDLCRPCSVIDYDFIGHFESLYEDADFVLRSLLGPSSSSIAAFPTSDPDNMPSNRRQRSSQLAGKLFRTIPEERRRKLKEIYRLDFEMFEYD
jgi:hypothetical protein